MHKDPYGRAALVCFLLAALCFWAMAAEAAPLKFRAATGALAGLAAVDLAQSVPCVRAGAPCREVNPVFSRLSPAPFVVVKAAGMTVATVAAWRMRATRPRTAWALLLSLTAAQGFVVAHNARVK
jgi:hypothetical protein